MDTGKDPADHRFMVGRPRNAPRRPQRGHTARGGLFIGEWIRALGYRPVDVVRATGVNEGYLSELISGKKRNPSVSLLADIADFLGIPMGLLRRPPPDQEFIREAAAIDPAILSRLKPQ